MVRRCFLLHSLCIWEKLAQLPTKEIIREDSGCLLQWRQSPLPTVTPGFILSFHFPSSKVCFETDQVVEKHFLIYPWHAVLPTLLSLWVLVSFKPFKLLDLAHPTPHSRCPSPLSRAQGVWHPDTGHKTLGKMQGAVLCHAEGWVMCNGGSSVSSSIGRSC